MGLVSYNRNHLMKPSYGATIDWAHPLSYNLASVHLPIRSWNETDLVTLAKTSPTTSPFIAITKFGFGWRNDGSSNQSILTQYTPGYFKNCLAFSIIMLVRITTVPGSGGTHVYFYEPTEDSSTAARVIICLRNNNSGVTGIKFDFGFRTGNSTSTFNQVNPASGGTSIASGSEYIIGCVFDSLTGEHKLYLNGILEASLSQSVSSITNTSPISRPLFLMLPAGGSAANGAVAGFYVWRNRVLTPHEMLLLSHSPFQFIQNMSTRVVFHPLLQYAYATSDVSTGNWTVAPLYEKIDEVNADDSDSIKSGASPSVDTCEFHLTDIEEPVDKSLTRIRYRVSKTGTGNSNLLVALYQGSTLIKDGFADTITTDFIEGVLTLSASETANITNWSDLRIKLIASMAA